jgi:hypothetical protein
MRHIIVIQRDPRSAQAGMTTSTSGSARTSASAQAHVDEMLSQGASLDQVGEFIDRQPYSEEDRAVMWLRAWAKPRNTDHSRLADARW